MSFGYSAGDCFAGATLTYRLISSLYETRDASKEFQEAMDELGSLHQTFMLIGQMKPGPLLDSATVNAASHLVLSSVTLISEFFDKATNYKKRMVHPSAGLGNPSSLSRTARQRVEWVMLRRAELAQLRDTLQSKLNSINVLLSAANFNDGKVPRPNAGQSSQYQEEFIPQEKQDTLNVPSVKESTTPRQKPQSSAADNIDGTNRSDGTSSQQQTKNENLSMTLNEAKDLRREIRQLIDKAAAVDLKLEKVISGMTSFASQEKPIKFKDAVGRKFSFPFKLCSHWKGMEELVRQAFIQIDVLGPHVDEGHYDLIGPNSEIILPAFWESVIQPDMAISMHMWPLPEDPIADNHKKPSGPGEDVNASDTTPEEPT